MASSVASQVFVAVMASFVVGLVGIFEHQLVLILGVVSVCNFCFVLLLDCECCVQLGLAFDLFLPLWLSPFLFEMGEVWATLS